MGIRKLLFAFLALAGTLAAQQPQTQTAPIYSVNAKYANGVAPGYWPQAGAGLVLNVGKGTVICGTTPTPYAGGTLTMANNATNYVYLDTASSCAPGSNTSGFTSATIPIAVVVTSSGVITTITDDRTPFSSQVSGTNTLNGVAYPSSPSLHSVPVVTATNVATYKVLPNCLDSGGQHLNYTQSTDVLSCGNSGTAPPNGTAAPSPRRWAYLSSNNTANSWNIAGGDYGAFLNCNSVFPVTSSFPTPSLDCSNGTTIGNGAGAGGGSNMWFTGNNLLLIVKARFSRTTSMRAWIGWTDHNYATMYGSASPSANVAAFRYDTTASDTNYQCKTSTGGGTFTSTDSGVAADTSDHVFKIIETNATSWKFYIDGSLVCTHTTNLPSSGVAVAPTGVASTQAASVLDLYLMWFYEESDQ